MKILLQRVWELKVGWDEPVPEQILVVWQRWRRELPALSSKSVPRCYFPRESQINSIQLHGFSDASEVAYAGVVYFRLVDSKHEVHTSLIMSKTKVAPIKRLSIPRLELCGAVVLAKLLQHVQRIFNIPQSDIYAWTDSTVVLGWLTGNPRRFKTYVGNRVSSIVDHISPDRWRHVAGADNPADCASRGIFPLDLLDHRLWWHGPQWLREDHSQWPISNVPTESEPSLVEEREICHVSITSSVDLIDIKKYSSFTLLKRLFAWIFRFLNNCRSECTKLSGPITLVELDKAENHLISTAQSRCFQDTILNLKKGKSLSVGSRLQALHPFIDNSEIMRVGGRLDNSGYSFSRRHPAILDGQDYLTKLIIRAEHIRLLHAGPTLVSASLGRRFHITGQRKSVRTVTRACITCRRMTTQPRNQIMGQLPLERVTPGIIFEQVGVDYAGPVYIKLGRVRKPTIVKSYIGVFVAFSIKAVHLELISDLTSDAFIAALRRFIARRGKPHRIWSDHGSNFVGADRELAELAEFLENQKTSISDFCSTQRIEWTYIPERAPHFGGLWESAVKSAKTHLKKIVGNTKLNFEEFCTVLTQVEACLNSRPLVPLNLDEDGIEPLTPGHFLIGRPIEALPDPPASVHAKNMSSVRRWNLCQLMVRHFWARWSSDYFNSLRKYTKWHHPSRNVRVDDIVLVKEDNVIATKWPLGRIMTVHAGHDGTVRVVTVKTTTGTYRRPTAKIALLLPAD